ncbi:conserved protein, unknown function [Hepatocystis sp. ex Piliocolobus tephrosceles]|nr:conserved protein, unknown function [Hepatocystis sp. ex Piliocolobus tephrosceles]
MISLRNLDFHLNNLCESNRCLSDEERLGLMYGMTSLEEKVNKEIYLWGKIEGIQNDYYITYFFNQTKLFPKKMFYYCTDNYEFKEVVKGNDTLIEKIDKNMSFSLFNGVPNSYYYRCGKKKKRKNISNRYNENQHVNDSESSNLEEDEDDDEEDEDDDEEDEEDEDDDEEDEDDDENDKNNENDNNENDNNENDNNESDSNENDDDESKEINDKKNDNNSDSISGSENGRKKKNNNLKKNNSKNKKEESKEKKKKKKEKLNDITEIERLSYVIRKIDKDAFIVPYNSIKITNNLEMQFDIFNGLNIIEALKLTSWVHFRYPKNLTYEKIKNYDTFFLNNFLDCIKSDIPTNIWNIKINKELTKISISNYLYPGYVFYHTLNTPFYASIYIGNGISNYDLPFLLP